MTLLYDSKVMADARPTTPDDVSGRVLRRAEVAKMSRKLQDRLALASYKAKHGLDSLSFSVVEAQFQSTSARNLGSSILSSSSSTPSDSSDSPAYSRPFHSSPVTARIYSDIASSQGPRKRARFERQYTAPTPLSTVRRSKKGRPQLQSSPIKKNKPATSASSPLESRFPPGFSTIDIPNFSFMSSSSTVSDSPPFDPSNIDTFELPAVFHGSPPRTPPPSRPRGLKSRRNDPNGEEGADLLLYLATSPSPAQPMKNTSRLLAPSTPPSNPAPLPSSIINTPGGGHNLFTGLSTPGQPFNFADFCNVTPSPAQAAFSRTPGPAKTPVAASEARRRLNFDSLLPPNASPSFGRSGQAETGLGMDLGGELRT